MVYGIPIFKICCVTIIERIELCKITKNLVVVSMPTVFVRRVCYECVPVWQRIVSHYNSDNRTATSILVLQRNDVADFYYDIFVAY